MKTFDIPTSIPTTMLNGIAYVEKSNGELMQLASVKPQHIEEDEVVRRLSSEAAVLNRMLADFRLKVFAEVSAYRDLISEKYGVKRGGRRNGVVLSTIDTSLRLTISISDTLAFGPELDIAKELIDNCIRRWSEGSNQNIRALVDQAFQVDKAGKIRVDRILELRRVEMEDESGEWEKAMNIISDAIRVLSSKEHARFHLIDRKSGDQQRIPLDLANA